MKLRDYITRTGISVAEFGRRVGVENRQTMHKYVNGDRTPDLELIDAIHRETGGAVTWRDFLPENRPTHPDQAAE